MRIKSLVLLASIGATTCAVASIARADSDYTGNGYVVGSIGQAHYKEGSSGPDTSLNYRAGLTVDGAAGTASDQVNNPTGYKVELGYQFSPNFAVEGGYVDLGHQSYDANFTTGAGRVNVRDRGFDLAAVGILPIGASPFSVYGKLGAIDATVRNHLDGADAGGGITDSHSDVRLRPTYAVGGMYSLNDLTTLRVEAQRYDGLGDARTGESNVDLVSVGASYKFF